jgi:hypothetical protein
MTVTAPCSLSAAREIWSTVLAVRSTITLAPRARAHQRQHRESVQGGHARHHCQRSEAESPV